MNGKKEVPMAKKLTRKKAKKILGHGSVHGHPLTERQKGFFGARASGQPIKTTRKGRRKRGEK